MYTRRGVVSALMAMGLLSACNGVGRESTDGRPPLRRSIRRDRYGNPTDSDEENSG